MKDSIKEEWALFASWIALFLVIAASHFFASCAGPQQPNLLPDPNSDDVQRACVASCTAFVWTTCEEQDRSLDEYLPVGEFVQIAETLEKCSQECMRIADHLNDPQAKLECLSGVSTCEGVFECLNR